MYNQTDEAENLSQAIMSVTTDDYRLQSKGIVLMKVDVHELSHFLSRMALVLCCKTFMSRTLFIHGLLLYIFFGEL